MDPNKGHGENIRTYNWREKGRRSIGRSRIAASRRPDSQNVGPNGFHFPPSGRRIRAGRRPGGPTNQRVRDPVGAESSCATQPVFNGEAKRQNTPREYLPGGRGVIFEFDAQRSISSLVSPAALERAIIKRNVRPRIDSKPAPHKVAKSPDPYGVSD